MASRSKAAAHQYTYKFKETEVVAAICFGINDPFWFVLSWLISIVGSWYEETEVVLGL